MQQLSPNDTSSEASGSIIQLDFDKIYEDYQKQIERYWLKQGRDQESARDLCQDTFVHFLDYLSHHETSLPQSEYHVRNLLYRIAKNIKIDDYRRKKPINCQQLTESDAYIQFDELLVDDKLWLRKELAKMPPKYRACVVLKYYGGYTQKQIAAIVDISEAAVSMNVKHGIEYLRKKSYPVTIDLQSAEIMKELKYQFINGLAQINRQFLNFQYTWDRQYTKEELCVVDRIYQNVIILFGPNGELIPKQSPLILSLIR